VPKSQWDREREWFDGERITYIEYKKRMEFPENELRVFDEHISSKYGKQRWFASVWDVPSLERLMKFTRIPYVKIPSAMLTNRLLLTRAGMSGLPVILSTGMSTVEEVDEAIGGISPLSRCTNLCVMACNSSYPCADNEIDLRSIEWLAKRYETKAGFSSHSPSPFPVIYAAVLGAEIIEFHVTLGRHMQGTDHSSSLEEPAIRLICREIDRLDTLMGSERIKLYDSEMAARQKLRGS